MSRLRMPLPQPTASCRQQESGTEDEEREKVEGTQFARRKLKDVESGGILEIGATPLTEQCGRVRVLLMSRMILQIRDGRMDKGEDRKCLLMHIYSLETSSR